jgi:hypothetical protein
VVNEMNMGTALLIDRDQSDLIQHNNIISTGKRLKIKRGEFTIFIDRGGNCKLPPVVSINFSCFLENMLSHPADIPSAGQRKKLPELNQPQKK